MIKLVIMTNEGGTVGKTLSVAAAKARFSDCVRTAEKGQSVVITRWGRPVAALVPAAKLRQIERLLAAGPEAGLARMIGRWKGSEELAEILARTPRTPRRPESSFDE